MLPELGAHLFANLAPFHLIHVFWTTHAWNTSIFFHAAQCMFHHNFYISGVQVEFKQFHHLLPTFRLDFLSNTPILLTFPLLPVPEFDWDMFSHNRTLGVVVRRNHRASSLGSPMQSKCSMTNRWVHNLWPRRFILCLTVVFVIGSSTPVSYTLTAMLQLLAVAVMYIDNVMSHE